MTTVLCCLTDIVFVLRRAGDITGDTRLVWHRGAVRSRTSRHGDSSSGGSRRVAAMFYHAMLELVCRLVSILYIHFFFGFIPIWDRHTCFHSSSYPVLCLVYLHHCLTHVCLYNISTSQLWLPILRYTIASSSMLSFIFFCLSRHPSKSYQSHFSNLYHVCLPHLLLFLLILALSFQSVITYVNPFRLCAF